MAARRIAVLSLIVILFAVAEAVAGVGDPQIRTDHPWYPGELACSTFERLAATQAEVFTRVTGRPVKTDEDRVLAAWLWRNTHYWHGEEGAEDLWAQGFTKGGDSRTREYWTGLFAHGFGLCGTTHSQWVAEMNALLGHGRGRGVGVEGHNTFEVFLTGGAYGNGRWALLDHDLSTVVFDPKGDALMSMRDVAADWKKLTDRAFKPERQHGWLICGLHPNDCGSYARYEVAEYMAGYAGMPPLNHLRRGETLRRYLKPDLADGKTFVFWGRNYNTAGVPGPERSLTWVNQPEKMYGSKNGPGHKPGQARYANAVYVYKPDFTNGDYREAVVEETDQAVVFEFRTPYIIAATPPNDKPWGIYETGCRNGLVLKGKADCAVSLSTDLGATWQDCGRFADGLDLTDRVKGRRQYRLRLHSGAKELVKSGLTITTVCQASAAVMPWLKDGGTEITFQATGRAVTSAGPNLDQAKAKLVGGKFGSPEVVLELAAPRKEAALEVHAAAHVVSGVPPSPDVKYQIDASTDGGATWKPVVRDWTVKRQGDEPKDFWSQSLCWGAAELGGGPAESVRVRFHNSGKKNYSRAEAHLVYRVERKDATRVTFDWTDDGGEHRTSHDFAGAETWKLPTGKNVVTRWVEFEAVPAP